MGMLLRISRDEWVERFFSDGRYYTSLRRRWEKGLKAFFLKKTSVGDSVIGYGVLDGFMSREGWLAAGGKPYDEHPWNTVLIFKHLVRFPRPVPVKDLGLDERLRGNRLHGYRIGDSLSDRILELAGYEKVNP